MEEEKTPDDVLEYLDALRESGKANMFGAGSYLMEEFGMNKHEARAAVLYWMKTFDSRNSQ